MITRLDFPSRDADRARTFYRETLGLRPDEHDEYEQWAGDTRFGIWAPETMGRPFVAQQGNPWVLGCDDVAATRAALEGRAWSSPATSSTPAPATWRSSQTRMGTR